MMAFSLTQMFGTKFKIGDGYGWHIGVGMFSGILGGLSSIWSPPVAMYLLARNVEKSEFIGATGFLFLAGSLPLALGLARRRFDSRYRVAFTDWACCRAGWISYR